LPLYNIPVSLSLQGRLDPQALAAALNAIVRRHEVLRTTFDSADGHPVQVIRPHCAVALPVVDLTGIPEPTRPAAALELSRRQARRPFDLARGPVLWAAPLRPDGVQHRLLLVIHHIAFDGWSTGVFLDELTTLYRGASLPELAVQYADFAVWQRQWLAGATRESQLAYWREALRGLPVLELPTDRPRPARQSFRGTEEDFELPAALGRGLRELNRQHASTFFMTLLAAFQALLGRYSAQQDFAVAFPAANRNRAEIEPLLGFFVNTLVVRSDLHGDPSFAELVAGVREVTLDAYAHQDLPFEQLVEALQPERDLSRNPLAQVMFVLQDAAAEPEELGPGLAMHLDYLATGTAKFDLVLGVEERAGRLRGDLEYSTELFDPTTIRRLVGHYRTLLEAVVADPDERLSELPLLSAAERQQLGPEWNDTAAAYPAEATIHQLFAAQAAASPEAVAVVAGDRWVSYWELDRRSDELAHRLGFAPEKLVGISLERSVEMVVGLLGTLKAGGGYVPLDPSYPEDRIAYMLEDSRAHLLRSEDLPFTGARETVRMPRVAPESPAYVLYTS
ncbi:MAG: AMP-binding protein, partial [bacterium]|nr:AMP-binding protein [bacterium]